MNDLSTPELAAILTPVALVAIAVTLIARFLLSAGHPDHQSKTVGLVVGLGLMAVTLLGACLVSRPVAVDRLVSTIAGAEDIEMKDKSGAFSGDV